MSTKAEAVVAGLGGIDNIERIEGYIAELRVEVIDPSLVDEAALKAAGASGVMAIGTAIRVLIGPEGDNLACEVNGMME